VTFYRNVSRLLTFLHLTILVVFSTGKIFSLLGIDRGCRRFSHILDRWRLKCYCGPRKAKAKRLNRSRCSSKPESYGPKKPLLHSGGARCATWRLRRFGLSLPLVYQQRMYMRCSCTSSWTGDRCEMRYIEPNICKYICYVMLSVGLLFTYCRDFVFLCSSAVLQFFLPRSLYIMFETTRGMPYSPPALSTTLTSQRRDQQASVFLKSILRPDSYLRCLLPAPRDKDLIAKLRFPRKFPALASRTKTFQSLINFVLLYYQ